MNNPLPAINIGDISQIQGSKPLTGSIENISSLTNSVLQVNDVLTLQFIEAIDTATSTATVRVSINGQNVDIPLNIKLDAPLKNIDNTSLQGVEVKITSVTEGKVAFRVVNNINTDNLRPQTAPVSTTNAAPLQINSNGSFPATITPLELKQVVEYIGKQLNLSPQSLSAVISELPDAELVFNQPALNSTSTTAVGSNISPNSDALAQFVKNIQTVLSSTQAPKEQAQSLMKVFSSLPELSVPLRSISYPQSSVLESPLGNFYPEQAVKVADNLQFNAVFKELRLKPTDSLQELFNVKLWQDLADIPDELLSPQPTVNPDRMTAKNISQDSVETLLKWLSDNSPKGAEILQNKLPNPSNERFIANLVSFVKASRHQDLSDWLGKGLVSELKTTTADGLETLERLNTVLTQSSREAGAWRIIEVPILNEAGIANIRLAVKRREQEEEDSTDPEVNKQQGGLRFLIESSFSRLGKFQLDGIAFEDKRRFDLIIRTEKYLPDDLCSQLMQLFHHTLQEQDYAGVIQINRKEKFISPWKEADAGSDVKGGILV